jgi:S1-C subfamily serine protease
MKKGQMGDYSIFFIIIIIILVIIQISFSAYSFIQFDKLKETISNNELFVNQSLTNISQDINLINTKVIDVNSEINGLKNSIKILSDSVSLTKEKQSQLEKELNSTKKDLSDTQSKLETQINDLKKETSPDFSEIIEEIVYGVVSIKTSTSQGTGFIITEDGYVVTNSHVIEGSSSFNAITANQQTIPMELIDHSSVLDLSLLKIPGSYDKLTLANSDNIKVGEKVIAIGNPYGLSFSVSEGIVSATDRIITGYGGEYVQTDAAINFGNSGGPLINTQGLVIGINNLKIAGGDNLGFALESNYVFDEVNKIALDKLGNEII